MLKQDSGGAHSGGRKPSRTRSIEVRCLHCRKWFRSPIQFEESGSFDSSAVIANVTNCPHCGRMTGCDKENYRASFDDGGFRGNTVDP